MNIKEYSCSKGVTLCFIGIGMVSFAIIMVLMGGTLEIIIMSEVLATVFVMLWLICSYATERRRIVKLARIIEQLDKKYLLGEVMPSPGNVTERQYYDIMKTVSRSAIGIVEDAMREQDEYRDYVESWIHEIKTPLTACSLILDNDGDVRKLRRELKRADNLTESILYYARMRSIEKDTQIKEVRVAELMDEAAKSQMEILIAADISIEVTGDFKMHTDSKSLLFIFKQLLINCGKYCPGCHVKMMADQGVITVEDDGIGIPAHEVKRVTDRGFSGSNGRAHGKSTGMGLYIVKELCRQLDIGLEIRSEEGKYTKVRLLT
ncbi:MAG: HAMP domain-containing histidine kinase [Clostridiales bacterium]|nr:HAMP domain-containing histidine kinase [Clostridiales bacterium]